MGVPKFFRYMSERYPCLSEVVKQYQIPEFDNLYLDMNGIIHMCSHPDDNNPHFRITEEKIFADIFHYIEVLFRMIRPQKLFFMAVDGVAPRAKMNQQRGRRFRSAKDAEKMEKEAQKKGEKLPDAARFDSNCITPGTEFMAKLQKQLEYFVVQKMSTDKIWKKCKVILSGHETPGEGEHKIMDYIRYTRAQPGYDPNTRHCLYGLDADLIMLGLCTHEPHFSLLREEVKFGKKSTKRNSVPEDITFFLLHLSLMREYLELEFSEIRDKLEGFQYDFEKIIDDWVLMGFLVGNDFIPHLPHLHINEGALPILYKVYMDTLPTLDGYINEAGTLNLKRFEKFMEELSKIDVQNFEEIRDDLLYMEAKTGRKANAHVKVSTKPRNLEEWSPEEEEKGFVEEALEPGRESHIDPALAALIQETDDLALATSEEESEGDDDNGFRLYKEEYYRNKMEFLKVTPEIMRDQAEGYIRAIQWNLNYYYNGVCSWSWYYPHHYAPYISDIKGFSDLKLDFELGQPFKPYEQLLAVLPAASKCLLPKCYHELMTNKDSLIKKYYPEEFETDLNGKKQEWEAVVLVPFIDENLLLEAMKLCNDKLTPEEVERNRHGPMLVFIYSDENLGTFAAPEYFPKVAENHALCKKLTIEDVRVPKEKLVKGPYPGVKMDVYYPGFPTMKHLKYKGELRKAKVKVFEYPSRNDNMIISIIPDEQKPTNKIAEELVGKYIFVGWPHLVEAKVITVVDSETKYMLGSDGDITKESVIGNLKSIFNQQVNGVHEYHINRMGIDYGNIDVLVQVQIMVGRKYMFTANGRINLEKQFSVNTANYPIQGIVKDIAVYDKTHTAYKDIQDIFPVNSTCFVLTNPYYGSTATVIDSNQAVHSDRVKVRIKDVEEPNFNKLYQLLEELEYSFMGLKTVAGYTSMSPNLFSRITGSVFILDNNNQGGLKNTNIGLDLKFNKKNMETPGYTKKINGSWCYSQKSVDLVRDYQEKFPEVFEVLSRNNSYSDMFKGFDIFGEEWESRLKELTAWLKSLPTHNIERKICGSNVMQEEIIKELEAIIDGMPKPLKYKEYTIQIKPHCLYQPELQTGNLMPDISTKTEVLDRIVNVRESFSVPVGLRGTVTAVHKAVNNEDSDIVYDVVYDEPFAGGMTLSCSENRGYRMPRTAFINISHGKRLLNQHLKKHVPIYDSQQMPYHSNFANQPNRNYNRITSGNGALHQPFGNGRTENSAFASFSNNNAKQRPTRMPDRNVLHNDFFPFNQKMNPYEQPTGLPNSPADRQSKSSQKCDSGFDFATQNTATNTSSEKNLLSSNNKVPELDNQVKIMQILKKSTLKDNTCNTRVPEKEPLLANNFLPPSSSEVTKDNSHPKDTRKVDTDFLKKMLRIDSIENSKIQSKQTQQSSSVKEFFSELKAPQNSSHSSTNLQSNTEQKESQPSTNLPANNPPANSLNIQEFFSNFGTMNYTIQLFKYYSKMNLGLPRYQYFNLKDGQHQAQLTLPDRQIIIGKPSPTKELSGESVAEIAMNILIKKTQTDNPQENLPLPSTATIPVPPKQWVQQPMPQNQQDFKQQRKSNSSQGSAKSGQNSSAASTSKSSVATDFVPLQAIKHVKKNKSNVSKNNVSLNKSGASSNEANKSKTDHAATKQQTSEKNASPKKDYKPRGQRQMRLAANFFTN